MKLIKYVLIFFLLAYLINLSVYLLLEVWGYLALIFGAIVGGWLIVRAIIYKKDWR
ncbi:hypothetical protein [Streptococcus suis]|nr:hypothetical protein [Streptococcus suis]